MNKKGAELTIGTIVVIVLALIVLVVVALGFTTGWTKLWEKINIFGGSSTNLVTIAQACKVSCTADDRTAFCLQKKSVQGVLSDGKIPPTLTSTGKPSDKADATCAQLVSGKIIDIGDCSITCSTS